MGEQMCGLGNIVTLLKNFVEKWLFVSETSQKYFFLLCMPRTVLPRNAKDLHCSCIFVWLLACSSPVISSVSVYENRHITTYSERAGNM
jgi:hypothetical protein